MSVEALITYTCDAKSCEAVLMADHQFDIGPSVWFQLTEPLDAADDLEILAHLGDDTRHFCSVRCLTEWASSRLGVELGLPEPPS